MQLQAFRQAGRCLMPSIVEREIDQEAIFRLSVGLLAVG
jgi:hypothetical protein